MKCPFKKVYVHVEAYSYYPEKTVEHFAECDEWKCPFYDRHNYKCSRVKTEEDSERPKLDWMEDWE